jgi:photosystem II stability/assembly factor-like uncharacterized protein
MPRFGLLILACTLFARAVAYPVNPKLFQDLHWRLVGPFRGGRALAVTGVPGNLEAFYFGAVGGGVWYSGNAGRTWNPVFEKNPMASIGAIAVAPSDPNVVYVGTGEADMRSDIQQGNGMYKSLDGGKSWTHIGLEDSRQIGKIIVDPRNPSNVFVAALGHQYGPNAERGVFKTTDGGRTWSKILFKDSNTGAIDLAMDPVNSQVVYASLWQTRRPPWSVYPPSNGPGSGLYKSSDGGSTWSQIKGHGFPSQVGRIGLSISRANPNQIFRYGARGKSLDISAKLSGNSNRLYACVDSPDPKAGGVYRSDDGGKTWLHTANDPRIWGRGWYFMGITADPMDPDVVYVMNTSAYRSTDGGKTFIPFKGAPGGDDYHTIWVDPTEPSRMIIGSDQGVIVSVDSGKTWSSWYNQPTGQFYHVATDNRFPYWIYGSQQDSGAMALPSRTIHTGVSSLYQRPIDAGGESGTIAPDPLHPGLLFSSTGSKESLETGWEQTIDPTLEHPETSYRSEWTMPIAVSLANPKVVYTSHQVIFRSDNGGSSWKTISPDLTRQALNHPQNLDAPTAADNDGVASRGVVYWLAPSPIRPKQLWAGTDDGLIWLTRDDGKHWLNVTPTALGPWSKVGIIDASHFDPNTAYAAIDRHRLDDNHPYIYRTRDGGKHWVSITAGLPKNQFVNVVRGDPKQKDLLYAGTDWGVFVSFNDGESWQPLQLNLPAASVRDIVFGGNDVVVGTHGRAIWILDDVAMLRQLAAGNAAPLIKPDPAILFQRAGTFGFGRFDEGTPLPLDEPQGENPPWGAILDYSVTRQAGPTVLTIFDEKGKLVRRISSDDSIPHVEPNRLDIPAYWIQPPTVLSGLPGGHRYVWDLRYRREGGPIVPPGLYSVHLATNRTTTVQPLQVVHDPRVPVSDEDLRTQFGFSLRIEDEVEVAKNGRNQALSMLKRTHLQDVGDKLRQIAGLAPSRRGQSPAGPDTTSFSFVVGVLQSLEGAVESAPSAPNLSTVRLFRRMKHLVSQDFATLKEVASHRL